MTTARSMQAPGCERPLIVGLGGTTRQNSSTEKVVRLVLKAAERAGARVIQFTGPQLSLPMYAPEDPSRTGEAQALIDALRHADGLVLGSPAYHGGISGLVKNALDYVEDMACDERVYFDGMAVGCIGSGAGWQGANATLSALRNVTHALRGWPTPLGIALNSLEPLFDADGNCLHPSLEGQAEAMARQVIAFATRDASQVRAPRSIEAWRLAEKSGMAMSASMS